MAAMTVGFTACQDDVDVPAVDVPKASVTPNMTILELKEEFWSDETNYAKTITDENDPGRRFIIHGRVISSDEAGNVFKSLIIQDETAAIAFSIDTYNLYLQYRVGQDVVLDVTGMDIGKYAGLQQIGRKSWYENGNTDQVSFMSLQYFQQFAELDGMPDREKVDTIVMSSFAPITQQTPEVLRQYQSQVVRFKNVYFPEGGKRTFSVYHTSVNEEQNNTLTDAAGSTITVRTSGYCTFFNEVLPVGNIDLVGILSYYNNAWQIIMIDGEGVIKVGDRPGTKEKPYTVEQAIEAETDGIEDKGWVKGYIVGTVAPEVETVAANTDIQWTEDQPFILANNLVIASSADVRDYSKCLVVMLPAGSKFQQFGNLRDNPANIGKEILLEGNLAKVLGTFGITGNTGTPAEFEIEGVNVAGETVPDGDGQQATPYNVGQVIAKNPDNKDVPLESDVWVKGYIVGYMPSSPSTTLPNTVFGAGGDVETNIVIAPTADCTDYTKCIGVQLPKGNIRTALNLKANPGNLGALLAVKGNLVKYCGSPGVGALTDYTLEGAGENPGPDTPAPSGPTYTQTAEVASGSAYVFVAGGKYNMAFTKSYGYMGTTDLPADATTSFSGDAAAALTFTATEGGYTINTTEGKFLGAKTDFNTFDTTDESAGRRVWTVEFAADGTATIKNVATGKIVCQDPQYGSFGCYEAVGSYVLPKLYRLDGEGTPANPSNPGTPSEPTDPSVPAGDAISINGQNVKVDAPTTVGDYTITVAKETGTSNPAIPTSGDQVRLYAKNTIKIEGPAMAKIVFTIAASNNLRYTTLTPSTGAMSPEQAAGDKTATWVGDATSVTFTVGNDAVLGSDGSAKRGQVHIAKIEIFPAK